MIKLKIKKSSFKKMEDILNQTYEVFEIKNSEGEDVTFIDEYELQEMLEDMYVSYLNIEEEYKDFQQQVKDNYKLIPYWQQVGDDSKYHC